jgi:hypothetical protein
MDVSDACSTLERRNDEDVSSTVRQWSYLYCFRNIKV